MRTEPNLRDRKSLENSSQMVSIMKFHTKRQVINYPWDWRYCTKRIAGNYIFKKGGLFPHIRFIYNWKNRMSKHIFLWNKQNFLSIKNKNENNKKSRLRYHKTIKSNYKLIKINNLIWKLQLNLPQNCINFQIYS